MKFVYMCVVSGCALAKIPHRTHIKRKIIQKFTRCPENTGQQLYFLHKNIYINHKPMCAINNVKIKRVCVCG